MESRAAGIKLVENSMIHDAGNRYLSNTWHQMHRAPQWYYEHEFIDSGGSEMSSYFSYFSMLESIPPIHYE